MIITQAACDGLGGGIQKTIYCCRAMSTRRLPVLGSSRVCAKPLLSVVCASVCCHTPQEGLASVREFPFVTGSSHLPEMACTQHIELRVCDSSFRTHLPVNRASHHHHSTRCSHPTDSPCATLLLQLLGLPRPYYHFLVVDHAIFGVLVLQTPARASEKMVTPTTRPSTASTQSSHSITTRSPVPARRMPDDPLTPQLCIFVSGACNELAGDSMGGDQQLQTPQRRYTCQGLSHHAVLGCYAVLCSCGQRFGSRLSSIVLCCRLCQRRE
jgi:hypothetical protein